MLARQAHPPYARDLTVTDTRCWNCAAVAEVALLPNPVSRHIGGIPIETLGRQLLEAIKANLGDLASLLDHARTMWGYEDFVYRFYHGSFKVYGVQMVTVHIVEKLRGLLPDVPLNERFLAIVADGTGKGAADDVAEWVGRLAVPLQPEITGLLWVTLRPATDAHPQIERPAPPRSAAAHRR